MLVFINHTVDLLQNNNPGNKSIYTKNSQRNWLENQKGGGGGVVTKETYMILTMFC